MIVRLLGGLHSSNTKCRKGVPLGGTQTTTSQHRPLFLYTDYLDNSADRALFLFSYLDNSGLYSPLPTDYLDNSADRALFLFNYLDNSADRALFLLSYMPGKLSRQGAKL